MSLRRALYADDDILPGDLAESLQALGLSLIAVGRPDEGMAAATESLSMYQELARSEPRVFEPEVAKAHHHLGILLDSVGRNEEALENHEESVAMFRSIHPPPLANLAESLLAQGACLENLERPAEADACTAEAGNMLWPLFLADPKIHARSMGHALAKGLESPADPAILERVQRYEALVGHPPRAAS